MLSIDEEEMAFANSAFEFRDRMTNVYFLLEMAEEVQFVIVPRLLERQR